MQVQCGCRGSHIFQCHPLYRIIILLQRHLDAADGPDGKHALNVDGRIIGTSQSGEHRFLGGPQFLGGDIAQLALLQLIQNGLTHHLLWLLTVWVVFGLLKTAVK